MNHPLFMRARTPFSSLASSLRRVLILCLLPLALAGCDLFGEDDDESVVTTGALVANSGNFTAQDGSLTIFNPEDTTAALNDIEVGYIQSIHVRDNRLFVVDNNQSSGRVTIFDATSLTPVDQIENPEGLPPLSIAFASDEKAYVTNQNLDRDFSPIPSSVSVIELANDTLAADTVATTVPVGRGPRGIAATGNRAFVANGADGTLSVIDTDTDTVSETVDLNCAGPNEVFVDGENEVVVVCQGSSEEPGEILFLDSASRQVQDRISLSASVGSANGTQSAYYSRIAEELYAIDGGGFAAEGSGRIFRVDTRGNILDTTLTVPDSPVLTRMTAVGYDAITQNLYVSRLPLGDGGGPSFTASGSAVVLDRRGELEQTFPVGISPGYIDFLRDTR